jgi:hypothetical protein
MAVESSHKGRERERGTNRPLDQHSRFFFLQKEYLGFQIKPVVVKYLGYSIVF